MLNTSRKCELIHFLFTTASWNLFMCSGGREASSWPAIPALARPLKWGLGGLTVHFVYNLMLGEKKKEELVFFSHLKRGCSECCPLTGLGVVVNPADDKMSWFVQRFSHKKASKSITGCNRTTHCTSVHGSSTFLLLTSFFSKGNMDNQTCGGGVRGTWESRENTPFSHRALGDV